MINFLLLFVATFLLSSSSAAPEHDFAPLACNANIDSEECVAFSSLFSESNPASLTIPCGKCVTMDYTDGSTITVPGGLNVLGRLHFPSSANMVLRTTSVIVQGVWSMETPALGNTVKVSLYGSDEKTLYPHTSCCGSDGDINNVYGYECTCSSPEAIGKKPFAVAGGRLDIRAIDESCPSWTKLAEVNTSTMQSVKTDLPFAACLRPGDDLLFTSPAFNTAAHSTYTVDSVDTTTGEIFLQEVMGSLLPSLAGPAEPEFAVEVALLRRDVIFEAEVDPVEDWIGGHSIVYHTPNVVQTIQGVKFDNFGQEGVLGRYPIHFHMSGDTSSLVSKNVIVNSNQRCVFIHNTNRVTIDDNVSFDTKGHCYATETGAEKYNVFHHNLGAYTKKLTRGTTNKQSDSPLSTHSKGTSTFWIRNMQNTFTENVATGNVDTGYWLEMKDVYSNQLNSESFKDNSAHSNFRGFLTYKKGWKPKLPAVWENIKSYLNKEGMKFHITGNLTFKKALLADNTIGVRYGVWNDGVTFEDSVFIGLSQDRQERYGLTCPSNGHGIRATMNAHPKRPPLALKNVVFKTFTCGTESLEFYSDTRQEDDMGNPVRAENITFIDGEYKNKPRLTSCSSWKLQNWHMEDYDGTVGPDVKGPGFLIRNNARMQAFLPENSCESLWYDGSDCTAFCEGACLRLVHLKPTGRVTKSNTDIDRLELTDSNTGKSYKFTTNSSGKAIVVLPAGQYIGEFLDSNGIPVTIDTVEVLTYDEPRCSNFVTDQDFTFPNTAAPTPSPSQAPTITWDKSYDLAQTDAKCPWGDERRLFTGTSSPTVEDCRDRCFNMPECNYFTYGPETQLCLGCALTSLDELDARTGVTTYEMTSMKAPVDFGYDLWSGVDGLSPLAGVDKKCPWQGSDRIGKSTTSTRKGCYDLCKNTSGCTLFSWGEDHAESKDQGLCLLCQSDANLSGHTGIFSYSMVTEPVPDTAAPTPSPSQAPSPSPSQAPTTPSPTQAPSPSPSQAPTTPSPTQAPSPSPSQAPTTRSPTQAPSPSPSQAPTTRSPTQAPSPSPSQAPTITWDKSYELVQTGKKCPYGDERRLFTETSTPSVEDCHDRCFNMPECNYFTYGAETQLCLGCALTSTDELQDRSDVTTYEMTSMKAPVDFGYDLWSGVDGLSPLAGVDKKCPWNNSDRIGDSRTSTREGCYDLCKNTSGCTLFSWGEDHASDNDQGKCLLCQSDANLAEHTGIFSYSMV